MTTRTRLLTLESDVYALATTWVHLSWNSNEDPLYLLFNAVRPLTLYPFPHLSFSQLALLIRSVSGISSPFSSVLRMT